MKPEHAWALIGAGVLAYDLMCEEGHTLSEAFRKQPKVLQLGELALVGFHLLEVAPKVDPIHRSFELAKGRNRAVRKELNI